MGWGSADANGGPALVVFFLSFFEAGYLLKVDLSEGLPSLGASRDILNVVRDLLGINLSLSLSVSLSLLSKPVGFKIKLVNQNWSTESPPKLANL